MRVTEALASRFKNEGIERVWVFPGGAISLLLQDIAAAGIEVVVMRNENGAGHAAQAAYRLTGKPQVMICTSGPGLTNAITPIADAYYDGDAVLLISGQVATNQQRKDDGIRQRGFQETDSMMLLEPVTKMSESPVDAADVLPLFEDCCYRMLEGRPGPCHMTLPMDIGHAEADFRIESRSPHWLALDERSLILAMRAVREASFPLVIAGHGSLSAVPQLRALVDAGGLAVVTTLHGCGAISTDSPRWRGMIGSWGHAAANEAVLQSDCLIVLGARLDPRQIGDEGPLGEKIVIRVDIDARELEHSRVPVDFPFHCSVGTWLDEAIRVAKHE